jgi:hypothetical protein
VTVDRRPRFARFSRRARTESRRRPRRLASEDRPVRLEVTPFEPAAADLLGEQAILDRVIDVFENLTVTFRSI